MPTNKLTIVPVYLDPLPTENTISHSTQQMDRLNLVGPFYRGQRARPFNEEALYMEQCGWYPHLAR